MSNNNSDTSLNQEVLTDTIVDVNIPTYQSWKEPKNYFPFGQNLQQIILQKFGPVLGAMVFFVCLQRGQIANVLNSRFLRKETPHGLVTVDESAVKVENSSSSSPKTTKSTKVQFTAFVDGQLRTFEYDEPQPGILKRKINMIVSNGKKSAKGVFKNMAQGMAWIVGRARTLFKGTTKLTTTAATKGAGIAGLCVSAISYIDALSHLIAEVGTGTPTLIWHGHEDCQIKIYNPNSSKTLVDIKQPHYVARLTVANLAILAHYSYTGAIGGELGYSATQVWNIVGTDMTLMPDMTLSLLVLPSRNKKFTTDKAVDAECQRLQQEWTYVNRDITATASTFGNISGFAPILVSMFAGKLGSGGKTIRAGLILLLSDKVDELINRSTQSLEGLTE